MRPRLPRLLGRELRRGRLIVFRESILERIPKTVRVVLEIEGGCVRDLYTDSDCPIELYLVCWDELPEGEKFRSGRVPCADLEPTRPGSIRLYRPEKIPKRVRDRTEAYRSIPQNPEHLS